MLAILCGVVATLTLLLVREFKRRGIAERKLATLATRDGLTGLSNRWHFDEAIRREWRRARRTHQPLALLMIDADHFKLYNDRHGHQAGDKLLQLIGTAINDCIRQDTDVGARYGGDEFAILLPGTPLTGAARLAERIRDRLGELCREQGVDHGAQVSMGASSQVATTSQDHDALLEAADEALYRAKHLGRNRTELTQELHVEPGRLHQAA